MVNSFAQRHSRAVLLGIVVMAAVLGSIKINQHPISPDKGQTGNYWPIVNHLLDGEGYTLCLPLYFPTCPGNEQLTAMREPMPVLLFTAAAWASGRSLMATIHVQLLLHLAILVLLFLFVRRWKGELAALLASLGWALWLPVYPVVQQLSGDLVGTLFLMLSALALQRASQGSRPVSWVIIGALLGFAVLSRSVLLVMLLPWCWHVYRVNGEGAGGHWTRWKPVLVMGLALTLVLTPWVVRNKLVLGKTYVGTSMNGYNIYRNSGAIVGTDDYLRYVSSVESKRMTDTLILKRPGIRGDETEAELDDIYMKEGLKAIQAHPVRYATLSLYRFIPLWTNWGVERSYGIELTVWDHLIVVQQILLLPLFLWGLWKCGREGLTWTLAILVLVLAYMAVVAQVRYLVPVMPFIIAFAAGGLLHGRRSRTTG